MGNSASRRKARHVADRQAALDLIAQLGLGTFEHATAAAVCGGGAEFDLAVSQLNGTRHVLRVRPDDNVARLKQLIFSEAEIAADQQHLFINGDEDELREAATLESSGIGPDSGGLFLISK